MARTTRFPRSSPNAEAIATSCKPPTRLAGWHCARGRPFEVGAFGHARFAAPYTKISFFTSASQWCNDEKDLGLFIITPGGIEAHPIPREFPSIRTGGGVKRHVHLIAGYANESELIIAVQEPFADPDGRWGDRNFLFPFLLDEKKRSSWVCSSKDAQRP